MKVEILEVHGIDAALYGLGLSYGATSDVEYCGFNNSLKSFKMMDRADKNAHLGLGHNKYLESCMVWMKVTAPRFFWSEMDTYRLMTKQSDSTMHTLLKENNILHRLSDSTELGSIELLNEEQMEEFDYITDILYDYYGKYNFILSELKNSSLPDSFKIQIAKHGLPEAWEQTRVLCVSYKTLQNIYAQRKNHILHQWKQFCEELKQLPNSEWITKE